MNATIILSLIVICLTAAVIITTIIENRRRKPTLDEVTQFCIENNTVLCSKEWVEDAKAAMRERTDADIKYKETNNVEVWERR